MQEDQCSWQVLQVFNPLEDIIDVKWKFRCNQNCSYMLLWILMIRLISSCYITSFCIKFIKVLTVFFAPQTSIFWPVLHVISHDNK